MAESKTVLVVDDDERVRHLLTLALGREFRVLAACDGEECLALARQHRPHLILMDIDMPRLGGIEACQRLKGDPELGHIPVFLVTGRADEQSRRQGYAAGAEVYLTKPVRPLGVLDRVRERLAG